MVDDAELLRSYADDRSEAAFGELVRRHVDLIYSAALRRLGGDTHLAEDVCQKVFVALARQAGSLTDRAVLTGWLYTTCKFVAAEAVRTERRRRAREQAVFVMHELWENSETDADWEKLRPVLDEAMDQLNERDREALLLRFFENRPLAEVGGKLAVSEEAARKRVDRALEKLRSLLADRGIGSTSVAIGVLLANQTVVAAPEAWAAAMATSAMGVSGGGVSTLNLVYLMTSKTAASIAVVLLGLSAFTFLQKTEASHDAETTLVAKRRELARIRAEQLELETKITEVNVDVERLRTQLADTQANEKNKTVSVAHDAQAGKADPIETAESLGAVFMSRHPEVRQALIEWNEASQNSTFGALYRKLGLSSAQIAELQRLGRESDGFSREVAGKITTFQLGTGMSATEVEAARRELLGAAGYKEWIRFSNSARARSMADQVASELAFSDHPLTAPQYDEIAEALARGRITARTPQPRVFDWERVIAESQTVLLSDQLSVLTRMQVQDEFQQAWSGVAAKKKAEPATAGADSKR